MTMLEEIEKEKQLIARCEKSLALEKLKKRRADTRYKIELGGLVIKSRMAQYNKATILGALDFVFNLIKKDHSHQILFESRGENIFSN
ncbi:TPA: conjugal transfer protein TraD [Legionella pneumophila]|nr:conjugal transfer protein TraD [Legionella pneumophila]